MQGEGGRVLRLLMRVANSPRLLMACIAANLVICGEVFGLLEGKGPVTAVWWAIVTGSTVGYGDQYPVSTAGRGVAAWLIISSILLVAVGTAQLSSKLIVDRNVFTNEEQEELKHNITVIASLLQNVTSRSCLCIWDEHDEPLAINPHCAVHGTAAAHVSA